LLSLLSGWRCRPPRARLNVYAAASLREVFEQIDSAPTYTFLGFNQLKRQIKNGGPADVFASAAPQEAQPGARGLGASSTRGSRAGKQILLAVTQNGASLAQEGPRLVVPDDSSGGRCVTGVSSVQLGKPGV